MCQNDFCFWGEGREPDFAGSTHVTAGLSPNESNEEDTMAGHVFLVHTSSLDTDTGMEVV